MTLHLWKVAGGYGGSVMESSIGETLCALLRADGDGVLAPLVLAMVDVKKLEKVGGAVRGAMLQTDVLWTSLANGPLIWFNFVLEGAFHRSKYLCEMKHINLEVQFGI